MDWFPFHDALYLPTSEESLIVKPSVEVRIIYA